MARQNNDPEMLVLVPVAALPTPYPGSVVRWCSVCAAECWVSPPGLTMMDGGINAVCADCVPGVSATHEGEPEWRMLPGVAAELGISKRQARKLARLTGRAIAERRP